MCDVHIRNKKQQGFDFVKINGTKEKLTKKSYRNQEWFLKQ